jgi:hypothetical protein
MSCIIDSGIALNCFSQGGIDQVFLGTYDEALTFLYNTSDVITGGTITTGLTTYAYSQEVEYGTLNQVSTTNRENGTSVTVTTLSLKFIDLDETKRKNLLAVSKAPIVALVQANNGKWVFLGVEKPGRALETNLSFGTKLDDFNGAMVNVEFRSVNGMYFVSDAAAALINS